MSLRKKITVEIHYQIHASSENDWNEDYGLETTETFSDIGEMVDWLEGQDIWIGWDRNDHLISERGGSPRTWGESTQRAIFSPMNNNIKTQITKAFSPQRLKRVGADTMGEELRKKVIRLAHQKPELREYLLPLVKTSGFGYGGMFLEILFGGVPKGYKIENYKDGTWDSVFVDATVKMGKQEFTVALTYDLDRDQVILHLYTRFPEERFLDERNATIENMSRYSIDKLKALISKTITEEMTKLATRK